MNVKEKLLKARGIISSTKMVKRGENKFSKYKYFTPDQVSSLVANACNESKLITVFSLLKVDDHYVGKLNIMDVEGDGEITFEMVTSIPDIKATNSAQKIGGAMTYTQRYLEMSAFGIVDNNLDFDSQDNREPIKKTDSDPKPKRLTASQKKKMAEEWNKDNLKDFKAVLKTYALDDKGKAWISAKIKEYEGK